MIQGRQALELDLTICYNLCLTYCVMTVGMLTVQGDLPAVLRLHTCVMCAIGGGYLREGGEGGLDRFREQRGPWRLHAVLMTHTCLVEKGSTRAHIRDTIGL